MIEQDGYKMRKNNNLSTLFQCSALMLMMIPGLLFAEDTKVRYVNVPKLMQEAPQAQAAKERLRNKFSKQKKELEECNEDVDILDGKLRRDGREMEKVARDRMLETIGRKRRECSELTDELQEKYNTNRNAELEELNKLIYGIIEKMAESKEIDLIIGPPIIYTKDQVDLTEAVLDELSRKK